MTPPCYTFPAAELTERVQLDVHGRQRKMLPGSSAPKKTDAQNADSKSASKSANSGGSRHQGIDLARDCELLSNMVQYSCAVMHPEMRDSPVRCWPVQRLFRRCQDRNGSFTVETTAWEGTDASQSRAGYVAGSAASDVRADSSASSLSAASSGAGPPGRQETSRAF